MDDSALCNLTFESIFKRSSYLNILYGPIIGFVCASYAITILLMILRQLLWKKKWHFAKKFREADRKMIAFMLENLFNMLHHREGIRELEDGTGVADIEYSSSDNVKMEDKKADSSAEKSGHSEVTHSHMIHTGEILSSKLAVTFLSFYVASVSSLGLVVFWDVFLVKVTIGCVDEDGIDCFYTNGTYISQFCSCLSSTDQFEATCYEIALEFPMAIAEVAGILFLAFNGFTFLVFLKLLIADGSVSKCLRMCMYLLLALIEYVIVLAIIGSFIARRVLLRKEDTTNVIIEEFLISIALGMGVTMPWIMLLWALNRVVKKKKTSKPSAAGGETAH